jgi:hypothetical protein
LTAGFVIGFVLLIALLVASVAWMGGPLNQPGNQRAVEFLLLGLLMLTLLVVGAVALVRPPIRAKVITEQFVILTGVAASFPGAIPPPARFWGARGSSRSCWTPKSR